MDTGNYMTNQTSKLKEFMDEWFPKTVKYGI